MRLLLAANRMHYTPRSASAMNRGDASQCHGSGRLWLLNGPGYGSPNRQVLQFEQTSNTLTVRLPEDLATWPDQTARKSGVSRGRIVREELDRARKSSSQRFLRLAGVVAVPKGLSVRKGFSRK